MVQVVTKHVYINIIAGTGDLNNTEPHLSELLVSSKILSMLIHLSFPNAMGHTNLK